MRLIVLGDIHGNIEALKAVINDSISNYGNAINGFVFLGDYCCDFLEGEECIQLMLKLKEKYQVFAITGNRETGMFIPYKNEISKGKEINWDINSSMGAPLLSMRRMTNSSIEYIDSLNTNGVLEFKGTEPLYLQHKMPLTEDLIKSLRNRNIKNILTAHTHEIHVGKYDEFNLFNPGSVGLTDNGIKGADYGVMTYKNGHWSMEKKHIDYDYEKQISNCKNNAMLMENCKQWGRVLIASIETGINVAALYMFEKNRIANLYNKYNSNTDFSITEEPFGIGRYGNISPINTHLHENIILLGGSNTASLVLKYKTDEFSIINKTKVAEEDWMYDMALDNVLKYIEKINKKELGGVIYKGRRFN